MTNERKPKLTPVGDGYRNLTAGLGTDRDKATLGSYVHELIPPMELLAAYRSAWLPRKIVDIPAFDSIRRWRAWTADKDEITKIENEERRLQLQMKVQEAMIHARLYGGGAILISTDEEDTSKELVPGKGRDKNIRFLTVVPKQMLQADVSMTNVFTERFGKPEHYTVIGQNGIMQKIHHTRLVKFMGARVPWGDVQIRDDWGDSILTAVFDAIQRADSTAANIASLVFEAKVDVVYVPKLMQLISTPEGERSVKEYIRLAMQSKGVNGALILDGGDTSKPENDSGGTRYEAKSQTFAGLDSVFDRFLQAVSGAADIPATRLLGQSPIGMNATGESDLRNYYDHIQSIQNLEITPEMALLDELLVFSATGQTMGQIFYDWRPLWQPTDEQKLAAGKDVVSIIGDMAGLRLWPEEVLAEAGSNAMIETGALPGLETAIDKWTEENGGEPYEPDVEDLERGGEAYMNRAQPGDNVVPIEGRQKRADVTDANPYHDEKGRFTTGPGKAPGGFGSGHTGEIGFGVADNPLPRSNLNVYEATGKKRFSKKWDQAFKEETLPVATLKTRQTLLDKAETNLKPISGEIPKIKVARLNGENIVLDGNHRAASLFLQGAKEVRADVIDLDDPKNASLINMNKVHDHVVASTKAVGDAFDPSQPRDKNGRWASALGPRVGWDDKPKEDGPLHLMPVRVAPKETIKKAKAEVSGGIGWDNVQAEEFTPTLDNLVASQDVLQHETMTSLAKYSPDLESKLFPGTVYESGGQYLIFDGHHRAVAAALAGRSLRMKVYHGSLDLSGVSKVTDMAPRALYVRRDVLNADEILKWAREQGIQNLLPAEELHTTVVYSRQPIDWMQVGEAYEDKIEIKAGGPRSVEQFGAALVVEYANFSLSARHNDAERAGATWDHDEYRPHVTLSYDPGVDPEDVEPYRGRILLGPEIFENLDPNWNGGEAASPFVETADANPNHHPAGTPGGKGGQFAPKNGGAGGSITQKRKDYYANVQAAKAAKAEYESNPTGENKKAYAEADAAKKASLKDLYATQDEAKKGKAQEAKKPDSGSPENVTRENFAGILEATVADEKAKSRSSFPFVTSSPSPGGNSEALGANDGFSIEINADPEVWNEQAKLLAKPSTRESYTKFKPNAAEKAAAAQLKAEFGDSWSDDRPFVFVPNGASGADVMRRTVAHEIGHSLTKNRGILKTVEGVSKARRALVSQYATTSDSEYLAEAASLFSYNRRMAELALPAPLYDALSKFAYKGK